MEDGAGTTDDALMAAHQALRDQGDVQFTMTKADPPPAPPEWLEALGRFLERVLKPVGDFFSWLGSFLPDLPYVHIIFWTIVAILAVMILLVVIDRLRNGVWRRPTWFRRKSLLPTDDNSEPDDWQPDRGLAHSLLEEADALAASGRFAEAAHHLLIRSIEDLQRRRPQLVRPALTSRDLALAKAIPAAPRQIFARIAAVVERSLFGGRPVSAQDWSACRAAYADFAAPKSWRGSASA